jgi:hypothetical protein
MENKIKKLKKDLASLVKKLQLVESSIEKDKRDKQIKNKIKKITSDIKDIKKKIKKIMSLINSNKKFRFIKFRISRVKKKLKGITEDILKFESLTNPQKYHSDFMGELGIGLLAILFFVLMKFIFLKYSPWYINLALLMGFIFFAYYKYLSMLINSWQEHPLKIMASYVGAMLTISLLFYPFYFLNGLYGGFYDCRNISIKAQASFYFSVSNTFSLSYIDPICTSSPFLKFLIGFQGILGNVITVIILGIVIGAFFRRLDNKSNKKKK